MTINFYNLSPQEISRRLEELKDPSSYVFIRIPQSEIEKQEDYQKWLITDVEIPWMTEFNSQNADSYPHPNIKEIRKIPSLFETERGIWGTFGEYYIGHCKLYRYGYTFLSGNPKIPDRGFLIGDHPSDSNTVKVHIITDNLEEFLKQERIEYQKVEC